MKIKILLCLLAASLSLSLQAYVVDNQLTKSIVLSNFVYYIGSFSIPVQGQITVASEHSWAESQEQPGMTASLTATVNHQTFNISGILYNNVIVFQEVAGNIVYTIN